MMSDHRTHTPENSIEYQRGVGRTDQQIIKHCLEMIKERRKHGGRSKLHRRRRHPVAYYQKIIEIFNKEK